MSQAAPGKRSAGLVPTRPRVGRKLSSLILARPKVLRLTEAIPEMSNKTELHPTLLDLSFTPCLEQVSTVRRFLEDYYQPLLNDPDLLCRMAIAIHELLENASKYSARG